MTPTERVRAWRAAHPDRVKQHILAQHAKRKADPTYTLGRALETRRQKKRNDASRATAGRAHQHYTEEEDAQVRSDQPAAVLARALGRSIRSIANRRRRLASAKGE